MKIVYSTDELKEFEPLIRTKLERARESLDLARASLGSLDTNGTDDTYAVRGSLTDGSLSEEREEVMRLIIRQQQFIHQLEQALVRIHQGTYGICRVSGKLIPKERLRAVPHATLSLDAKVDENRHAEERFSPARDQWLKQAQQGG